MARFPAPRQPKPGSRPVVNLAGGQAFDRDPRVALASYVLTSMVQDTFYQSADEQIETVRGLVRNLAVKGDLLFAAKAAVHARHEGGLRSISHVVAGEVAQLRGEFPDQRGSWGPTFFTRVVHRLDDMSEIAGYWIGTYAKGKDKKTLPNAMKRGFGRVFANAKPGLLAKWDGETTRSLTLRQLAHLCHPKGGKDSTVYKLRAGTLVAADTHEVAMTRAGQVEGGTEAVATAKAEAWGDLFRRGKVQYLAALRNARNIIEQAPDQVDALVQKLLSLDDIRGSKVLPFQFLPAYAAVTELSGPHARKVLGAIENAAELALSNVPKFEGATLVCLDDSGSMHTNRKAEGNPWHKRPAIVGSMFVVALARTLEDCDVMRFSEDAHYVTLPAGVGLFDGITRLTARPCNHGTNFHAPFQAANRKYDRIILLSDAQGWMAAGQPGASLRDYEKRYEAKPQLYSWDLVGSSTSQFPAPRQFALAGISDRAFDLMGALEQDPNAMVARINALSFE